MKTPKSHQRQLVDCSDPASDSKQPTAIRSELGLIGHYAFEIVTTMEAAMAVGKGTARRAGKTTPVISDE